MLNKFCLFLLDLIYSFSSYLQFPFLLGPEEGCGDIFLWDFGTLNISKLISEHILVLPLRCEILHFDLFIQWSAEVVAISGHRLKEEHDLICYLSTVVSFQFSELSKTKTFPWLLPLITPDLLRCLLCEQESRLYLFRCHLEPAA